MSETPKFGGAADDKTPSGSSGAKSRVEVVTVNLTVNAQRRTISIEPRYHATGKRSRDLPRLL